MPEVAHREAEVRERRLERVDAGGRAAVDERRLVAGQEVGGDDPRSREVQEVEKLEAVT
jgi:hypothetical protein